MKKIHEVKLNLDKAKEIQVIPWKGRLCLVILTKDYVSLFDLKNREIVAQLNYDNVGSHPVICRDGRVTLIENTLFHAVYKPLGEICHVSKI